MEVVLSDFKGTSRYRLISFVCIIACKFYYVDVNTLIASVNDKCCLKTFFTQCMMIPTYQANLFLSDK